MSIFNSENAKVLLPREISEPMVKATRTTSLVAQLSQRQPMRFGETDIIVFNDFPKAEFVDEGGEKSPTTAGYTSVTAKPRKAQVTMRFNEEVIWADEDFQLEVLSQVAEAGQVALSRALDLGVFHRINPLNGEEITSWDNYILSTSKTVEQNTADADEDFRAAVGLLVNASPSWGVNGAAIDPKFAWDLSSLKVKDGTGATSMQRYPQLGFGTDVTSFLGLPVAMGDTVSGTPEATDTKARAIVGDFKNGIRWGVQRELPVELIRFGDPDGQGDLKRQNQVALRLEIVYGWYAFADRFAVVKAGVDEAGGA